MSTEDSGIWPAQELYILSDEEFLLVRDDDSSVLFVLEDLIDLLHRLRLEDSDAGEWRRRVSRYHRRDGSCVAGSDVKLSKNCA